jgi:hypothetical protein
MYGEMKDNLEALQLLFDELNGFAEDAPSIHPYNLSLLVTHKANMSTGWKLTGQNGLVYVLSLFIRQCA